MKSIPVFNATRERSLGFALAELVRLIRSDFLHHARGYRLTPELWRLLYCLDRDQGCRQIDLAATLGLTPVTLGRMIDKLEHRGLVRRCVDQVDRRAVRLFLTRKAGPPISRMHALVADTRKRAMRGLPRSEQDKFWHFLEVVRNNLNETRALSIMRNASQGKSHGR